MKSFRTELENPVVEKDIIDLANKIEAFRNGKIDEDRFRSLRLARGVYGQRQEGVQMIRIKIPYGQLTVAKLLKICDVSDRYSTGNLHVTTRQDIQIHYVKLEDSPELWAELESEEVTLREACGNTVRNVTASPFAGIDSAEPFDVTPYADAFFRYFLRNPICQDMGRKFKVSFSSSDADDSLSYIHDLGFIPKIKDGQKGFKVMLGGGLGSQPHHALVASEFMATDQIVPFAEQVLRVFDRHGERARRNKARMKYLIQDIGWEEFDKLLAEQKKALKQHSYPIEADSEKEVSPKIVASSNGETTNDATYLQWLAANVFDQKQSGFKAVGIKLTNGDISTEKARLLADIINKYAADDFRLSINQGILLRYVAESQLGSLYHELAALGLANPGFDGLFDITACPGTDTCNLGIASSMGLAKELERVLVEEYPHLVTEREIRIKISGCMNACGQHNMANIGFQGMTLRSPDKLIAPATQVLLGGGTLGNGDGRFADKVLKVPSKRVPDVLRDLLNDYAAEAEPSESFNAYYDRQGSNYFYDKLKHYTSVDDLKPDDFIDWGNADTYVKEIGVGECAGVVIDLVATLLNEAKESVEQAQAVFENQAFADAAYHAYNGMIYAAKAILTTVDSAKMNTQAQIVRSFDEHFVAKDQIALNSYERFEDLVYEINKNEPKADFVKHYIEQADEFILRLSNLRQQMLSEKSASDA